MEAATTKFWEQWTLWHTGLVLCCRRVSWSFGGCLPEAYSVRAARSRPWYNPVTEALHTAGMSARGTDLPCKNFNTADMIDCCHVRLPNQHNASLYTGLGNFFIPMFTKSSCMDYNDPTSYQVWVSTVKQQQTCLKNRKAMYWIHEIHSNNVISKGFISVKNSELPFSSSVPLLFVSCFVYSVFRFQILWIGQVAGGNLLFVWSSHIYLMTIPWQGIFQRVFCVPSNAYQSQNVRQL